MNLKSSWLRLLAVAIASLLLGAGACHRDSTGESSIVRPTYTGSIDRTEYQEALNTAPDRFEPEFDMVLQGTEVWMRRDADTGYCKYRCGTLRRTAGGIELTLPVGYIHGSDVTPYPPLRESVTRLTYWDEGAHQVRTITRAPNQRSVELPYILKDDRGIDTLRRGQVAYVSVSDVWRTPDGRTFLHPQAAVRQEPLGKQFMHGEDALIVKRHDYKGLALVLPKGYRPMTGNVDYWTPVHVEYAASSPIVPPVRSTVEV